MLGLFQGCCGEAGIYIPMMKNGSMKVEDGSVMKVVQRDVLMYSNCITGVAWYDSVCSVTETRDLSVDDNWDGEDGEGKEGFE